VLLNFNSITMGFFKNVLATIVGLFLFCFLFLLVVIGIAGAMGGEESAEVTSDNTVLNLDLSGIALDYAGKYSSPWGNMFTEGEDVGLTDVIHAIKSAATDPKIKGITIVKPTINLGPAQTKELRDALEEFKKSGKFILAYGDSFSQKEYYLSSVANSIYINPVGDMDFKGLATEIHFYKDLQEKTGVKIEVIRHGKYKSAVEPFLENKMSDANREQLSALLQSVWNNMIDDIAQSRKLTPTQLNAIADNLLARTPEMALKEKLIDFIAYEDEFEAMVKKKLKIKSEEDIDEISIVDYTQNLILDNTFEEKEDQIAIVYAQGSIQSGEGDVDVITDGNMKAALKEARENDKIKAIVLRVDSPGGSALTSDLIWREIEITKKLKPIVVSMGNYAASGGYYIACNANEIFAEKNTITGSIGVFGILPNLNQLSNKIGVNTEQVKTNANAGDYSPLMPLDANFKKVTQESVENIYNIFVKRVADGRKMSIAVVDSIAQGRVWTGSEALKIGLIDKIGGLEDALAAAAKLAKIKEFSTLNFPEFDKDFKDAFRNLPFAKSKASILKEEIGVENYELLKEIKDWQSKSGVQMLLPLKIKIQ
jgi:protease IV